MSMKGESGMRILIWFTLGFGASCGLWAWDLPVGWICTGLLTVLTAVLGRKSRYLCCAALILLGLTLGNAWCGIFRDQYLSSPAALDGETKTVSIRTTDHSYETAYGIAADGQIDLEGKPYPVRVYLDQKDPLGPGHVITGPFRFAVTAGEDDMRYHSSKGIFLLAYQREDVTVSPAEKPIWRDRIAAFRQTLRERLRACIPEDAFPFAQALLLGDASEIGYETDTDLKVSGIRHVVAVSGLHVSILFALLGTVTFRRKYLMAPAGLVLLLFFAALAGFTPSVVRACVMSGLMLIAMLLDREYDGGSALAFAVLVMLTANPLVIASVSFQLSAASVAGILLFSEPVKKWLDSLLPETIGKRLRAGLIASVSISFSAMVLTVPLCACYFGMVSLVSALTNLLVLWVVSGIFYGLVTVCLLSGFWMGAAMAVGSCVAWPVRYVLAVAGVLADFPLTAVYTESQYIVFWLVFVYILLFVFLMDKKRRPWQFLCCATLGLCVSLAASAVMPEGTQVTVLDVGQGQCILLEEGGRTFMVDCGGDSDTQTADIAAASLLSRGITRLDGLILTHLDRDHAGAVKNLLSRIDTELLILPAVYSDLGEAAPGKTLYAEEDLVLTSETMTLRIFAPTFPGTGNEKSLCVLFDTEKCDILITGDRDGFGERMLLRTADIPKVDVLIAGHHGSQYSTCDELLEAVSPETVCISAGKDNPFGHPAPELLQRLEAAGCAVYRTDVNGTITIRR